MALRKRSGGRLDSLARREFTEAELQDLRTAFGLLDRDSDGRVTTSELRLMLSQLGIPVRESLLRQLLHEDGPMTEADFLQWVARIQTLSRGDGDGDDDGRDDASKDLVAAFRVFDRDCNGYITKDELKTAMDMIGETVTDGDLDEMLAMADVDRDGKINYEEFARLLL